jgi:hypothetical protein
MLRETARADGESGGGAPSQRINADYNHRPQNEPAIGILLGTSGPGARWVVGANDYGIGVPIGGGVYSSEGVTYFPPFPLLAATDSDGTTVLVVEPPVGSGDPSLASGRLTDLQRRPLTYSAWLEFSFTFCENGVVVQRSLDNGFSWNRPVVPPFAPPNGIGFATCCPFAFDCSVFNDKEWIAVDNTGGPHDGRVYVTWTRFRSDSAGHYQESPIVMAYSDDNAITFSDPVVISGSSAIFCTEHANSLSSPTDCNEDQFSSPVVLPNGDLAVSFANGNGEEARQGRSATATSASAPMAAWQPTRPETFSSHTLTTTTNSALGDGGRR